MGAQAHRATQSTKPADVERRWFVVDAEDIVLGRLATRIATILRGKHRAIFTIDRKGVQDIRDRACWELCVNHRTDNLDNFSYGKLRFHQYSNFLVANNSRFMRS